MGSGLRPNWDSATDSKDPVVYRLNKLTIKTGDVSSAVAWDDLTGMRLDAGKVIEARAKEVRYVRDKEVYVKIPRATAIKNGWKVIRTRWIDINKGDDVNPVYRSRVVGKEFNTGPMDGLFAGTPPPEALRYLVCGGGLILGSHHSVDDVGFF